MSLVRVRQCLDAEPLELSLGELLLGLAERGLGSTQVQRLIGLEARQSVIGEHHVPLPIAERRVHRRLGLDAARLHLEARGAQRAQYQVRVVFGILHQEHPQRVRTRGQVGCLVGDRRLHTAPTAPGELCMFSRWSDGLKPGRRPGPVRARRACPADPRVGDPSA